MMMFNFNESIKNLYDYVVEFNVNNSKRLRSDALIGAFKLDIGNVYDQPGKLHNVSSAQLCLLNWLFNKGSVLKMCDYFRYI